jgi:hypothetical protein
MACTEVEWRWRYWELYVSSESCSGRSWVNVSLNKGPMGGGAGWGSVAAKEELVKCQEHSGTIYLFDDSVSVVCGVLDAPRLEILRYWVPWPLAGVFLDKEAERSRFQLITE